MGHQQNNVNTQESSIEMKLFILKNYVEPKEKGERENNDF